MLTINKQSDSGGPDSILHLCQEANLKKGIIVEDNMTSFIKAFTSFRDAGIDLTYGVSFTFCNDTKEEKTSSDHRVVILARNDDGCKLLNQIYSRAFTKEGGRLTFDIIREYWDHEALTLVIPFYCSFLHNNNFFLKNCIPDFQDLDPIFWIENNNLPFDHLLKDKVLAFSKDEYKTFNTQTVLYKENDDIEAFQAYKILCGRQFWKQASLSNPNLRHFGSDEFSFESYLAKS